MGLVQSPERASWPVVEPKVHRDPFPPPLPPAPKPLPRNTTPVVAKRARGKITIDGRLGPREWPDERIELKESWDRSPIPGPPNHAKVCYDEDRLYVAVIVLVKEAAKLSLGDKWGAHDGAEVCVQDISGEKPGPIFVVHGFVTGSHESVSVAGAPASEAKALGAATRFATGVGKREWTAEWAIPLRTVGCRLGPGGKLAFNVGIRRTESDEWILWAGTLDGTFTLDQAGVLVFE